MDTTVKHSHTVEARALKRGPAAVAPLTIEDTATPSARVVELTTRPGTAVAGFPSDAAVAHPGGRWVALFDRESGACVAAGLVELAETSAFGDQSGCSTGALRHSIAITRLYVDNAHTAHDLLPMVTYLALRRGRILERTNVVAYVGERGTRVVSLLDLKPLAKIAPPPGKIARCQRLDIAIHRAFTAAGAHGQLVLRQSFIDEAVETLRLLITQLLAVPYFTAVETGTLSREQYIYSLSNLHQFVRWTTRLLGRAVSLSHDPELRSHFLAHLSGEMNHEVILETDLAALGADVDVDYVRDAMVPNLGTQAFMVVQESLIGFHQDPVLFMAAPFAAEGFAASVTPQFITDLSACVRSWGVENPKKAIAFFASHVHFDGGDDGHWALTRDILAKSLDSDMRLQQFVNAVRLAMNGFIQCYASYVETLGIWTASAVRDEVDPNLS